MKAASLVARVAVVLGVAWGTLAAGGAQAADAPPRRYAVLSLVGDKITVVTQRSTVGSNLDSNDRVDVVMPSGLLDDAAAEAAGKEIMRAEPGSKAMVLGWREPAVFELQDGVLTPNSNPDSPFASLQGFLKQTKATHLLLITKHRADVRIRDINDFGATGKLRGLGFFVDGMSEITIRSTGKSGTGFLAPYAYVSVSVVDAQTAKVLRQRSVHQAESWPTAGTNATQAWHVMTGLQKVEALQKAVAEAVTTGVAGVLAP